MGPNKAATETKFFGELANRTSQAAGRASIFMFAAGEWTRPTSTSSHSASGQIFPRTIQTLSTYFGEQLRGTCRRLAIATQQHR